MVAPERLSAYLGMEGRGDLIRLDGPRAITTGVAILALPSPAPKVWACVGGDAA